MFAPGHRVYTSQDKLDTFNIIIKGKIAIFYPEMQKIQNCNQASIVYYNEAKVKEQLFKKEQKIKINKHRV